MTVTRGARKQDPSLPERWVALPADEIAALYHERWEMELGYDEIKTELLDREEAIRSQPRPESNRSCGGSSSRITSCASRSSESPPKQASNRRGSASSRRSDSSATSGSWCALASPGAIPNHLRNLRASLKTLILPPRRSERRFPRAVKIKMSNYARKRRKGSK